MTSWDKYMDEHPKIEKVSIYAFCFVLKIRGLFVKGVRVKIINGFIILVDKISDGLYSS